MARPRQILPQRFYMLTRRCILRQFQLRPSDDVNQIWLYCIAVAAQRYEIDVIFTSVLSNHHHTIVFDPHGKIIEFAEHLHKLVARAINAMRKRKENVWSCEPPSIVHLVDREDVMAKLIYAAINPVKDHLVERVHLWPGVNALRDFIKDRTLEIERPRFFFRRNGKMPATITLRFASPPELGEPESIRAALRDAVAAEESRLLAERRRTGQRIVGRREVLRQRCDDSPKTAAEHSDINPRIAARSRWSRIGTLCGLRAFQEAYRRARELFVAGLPAVFPVGTYWLRRFAAVPVAELAPPPAA